MYYHFKIPNNNLDHGLQALGNDADVMNLVRYIDKDRLIEVFIEHEYTILETYFKSPQKLRLEETDDVESSALARKPFKKPGLKVNRLPQLLLEGPSLNDDVEVPSFNAEKEKETTDYAVSESNEEDVNKDENGSESNEEVANEDETGSESSESSESDDSEDSDYIVDEDNVINEVDVDMQEFYQNIDKDVEWVGPSKGNVEVPAQVDVEEGFDLDDFDMDIDYDSDVESSKERKRALRALTKESKNKHCHFYVGQEFAVKKEATTLVSCQAVETRRQLQVEHTVMEYLMKRIVNVKKVISKSPGPLTPAATKLFEAIKYKATFYTVLWNGGTKYQVRGPYEDYYTINPINGRNLWSKHLSPYTIIPPKIQPQIGRPPKSRKKSACKISSQKMFVNGKLLRVGKSVTCGKCGMKGHNRTSCKGIVGGSQALKVEGSQASKVGGSQASKVGGSQGSSVGGSKASSVRGSKASSVGVSKRTRGSQTGTSSAAKRSKLF
ncbi:hypothetical protein Tco_0461933 [Tanacetum coccineum]